MMNEAPDANSVDDKGYDWGVARKKLAPKLDQSKRGRQNRQRKIAQSVSPQARDGRSLRSTGRTAQFNFKALEKLKPAAQEAASAAGVTLAEWMERAVNAALEAQGKERAGQGES